MLIIDTNQIIHRVVEEDGEDLKAKVGKGFSQLGEKLFVTAPLQVDNVQTERIIPVKVSLPSQDIVFHLPRKSKYLKMFRI